MAMGESFSALGDLPVERRAQREASLYTGQQDLVSVCEAMKNEAGRENPTGPVSFTIPLLPPTVNHYVKHTRSGRHYITQEAQAFKEAVRLCARGQAVCAESYRVEVWIHLGRKQRGDIDNFAKMVLDALVDADVIGSDAAISDLILHKRRSKNGEGRTAVAIEAAL